MRISVNLASRPFVELRPFFARLRVVMAGLAVLAIALGIVLHFEHKKLIAAEEQMAQVRHRTIAAQEEKLRNEARMHQPANAAVLDRARFLNALFLRKSFSWTAVMMDLENVLPTGVQVTAIEPQINAEGEVIIRLRVSGDRDRAIQLVRNLERSSRFLAPRLSNETQQTKEQAQVAAANGGAPGGVEFDILANYIPLPAVAPVSDGKAAPPSASGANPRAKRAPKPTPKPTPKPGANDGVVLKPYVSPRSVTPHNPAAPKNPGGAR
jgi:type IV pilus assembly protein PilN